MVPFCSFQLVFFNIPLMVYLCWILLQRCFGHSFRSHLRQGKYLKIIPVHLLMLLLYIWHIYSCYFLHMTYGTLALLFSPLRTWLTLGTPVLIRCVWTLNSAELGTFIVRLKSHLSSWSLYLLIHLCSPGLCLCSRQKASIDRQTSGSCCSLDTWGLGGYLLLILAEWTAENSLYNAMIPSFPKKVKGWFTFVKRKPLSRRSTGRGLVDMGVSEAYSVWFLVTSCKVPSTVSGTWQPVRRPL